jgi:hypothetical protein
MIHEELDKFHEYSRILESQPTVEAGNSWWWNKKNNLSVLLHRDIQRAVAQRTKHGGNVVFWYSF